MFAEELLVLLSTSVTPGFELSVAPGFETDASSNGGVWADLLIDRLKVLLTEMTFISKRILSISPCILFRCSPVVAAPAATS
jgi:hypothetical protein